MHWTKRDMRTTRNLPIIRLPRRRRRTRSCFGERLIKIDVSYSFRMISHPTAVLPRVITEWPEPRKAKIIRVPAREVQTTLAQFPSKADLRHLKRIRPTGDGQMDILVGIEGDKQGDEDDERLLIVEVASRAPQSDAEWKVSSRIWPLPRPNCVTGNRVVFLLLSDHGF